MQPLPDNTSALFTLSFHASPCTHVAQDVAYKRRRRINIRLLPHGLSACERSSHDARPHQVDLRTHTHVQAHTWKWSSLECVAPGPPGWKSHSSRALSPVSPGFLQGLQTQPITLQKTMEHLPSSCTERLLWLFFTAPT